MSDLCFGRTAALVLGGTSIAQSFTQLPADIYGCQDITPDGEIIVGSGTGGAYYWRWQTDPAPTYIGGKGAVAVSDDGSVIAGSITDPTGATSKTVAARWTQATGWVPLGAEGSLASCGSSYSSTWDMNADGSIIVGDRPRCSFPPSTVERDLVERLALDRTMSTLRHADGDARRQHDVAGDVEQFAQLVFDAQVPHCERPAVPERPSGEQQVLTGRIHRGAFDHGRAAITLEADEHDDGDLFEVVDVVLHRVGESRRPICIADAFGLKLAPRP